MKNIHILPTDKPSRLYIHSVKGLLLNTVEHKDTGYNQNIYITSDEEIKKGDWIYKIDHSHTAIFNVHCEELVDDYNRNNNNHKKIIMTTNKDLDGVQAIDAEFLEWFVKNPSFERVEVNIEGYPCMSDGSEITFAQPANLGGSEDIRNNIVSYNKQEHTDTKNFVKAYDKKRYKIIIPKEEPKQTVQEYEQQGLEKYSHELKSKQDYKKMSKKFTEILTIIPDDVLIKYTQQETLEEAGLKHCELIDNFPALENSLFSFKEGAKWQAERSHSEAIEFAEWIRIKDLQTTSKDNWIGLDMKYYTTEELFEQFKK